MVCMPSTMFRFAGEGTQKFACPQKHCEYPESSTGSVSRQRSDHSSGSGTDGYDVDVTVDDSNVTVDDSDVTHDRAPMTGRPRP